MHQAYEHLILLIELFLYMYRFSVDGSSLSFMIIGFGNPAPASMDHPSLLKKYQEKPRSREGFTTGK
jgi:hypothetical protein